MLGDALKEILRVYTSLKENGHAESLTSEFVDVANKEYDQLIESNKKVGELEKRIKYDREQFENRKTQYVRKINQLKEDAELGKALRLAFEVMDFSLEIPTKWDDIGSMYQSRSFTSLKGYMYWYRQQKEGANESNPKS